MHGHGGTHRNIDTKIDTSLHRLSYFYYYALYTLDCMAMEVQTPQADSHPRSEQNIDSYIVILYLEREAITWRATPSVWWAFHGPHVSPPFLLFSLHSTCSWTATRSVRWGHHRSRSPSPRTPCLASGACTWGTTRCTVTGPGNSCTAHGTASTFR